MKKILLVEEDQIVLDLVVEVLRVNCYEVIIERDGLDGFSYFMDNEVDFVILGENTPNIDGYQLTNLIRKNNRLIPIVMLATSKEDYHEVEAFTLEVDDFIRLPVSMNILLKRIIAIFRRAGIEYTVLTSGDLRMKTDSHEIWFKKKRISLTIKEFEIMQILLENKNRVMTRTTIHERVWGYNYAGEVRNIDTHVKNIRRKMPEISIETVVGLGYKYVELD